MSILSQLWWSGVHAAGGEQAVQRSLRNSGSFASEVLAVGKAAASMCAGALSELPEGTPALVVTKRGHASDLLTRFPWVELIESGHPIPDVQSLLAGQRLYERVRNANDSSRLLMLVSGGASALVERLPAGQTLSYWQQKTEALVASGEPIEAINAQRARSSLIKSGRLFKGYAGSEVQIMAISDVQGDSLSVIGSGLADSKYITCKVSSEVVASNAMARAAIVAAARNQGIEVQENQESLYEDVYAVAKQMAVALRLGPPGLYLWGGEPTIELPDNPGRGGRNQSLSLALARELSIPIADSVHPLDERPEVEVLVAGTDGTDGPTSAAGGWLRNASAHDPRALAAALNSANAGGYLAARDELFVTGPTDTNVMDLVLCLKR